MHWQDYIFGIGNLILAAALLPSLMSSHKPAIRTSMLSGATLATFGIAFASLELWLSAGAVALSALLWFILAYQSRAQHKR